VNTPIRLQIYLFLLAIPLHLIWEVAQIRAYEFPETGLMTDVIGCLLPTLGDGLMTLIIFWTGWAVFRDSRWILKPALKGYLLMFVIGIFLAIIVELNALYLTGAWRYSEQMITIPVLGVGLLHPCGGSGGASESGVSPQAMSFMAHLFYGVVLGMVYRRSDSLELKNPDQWTRAVQK